MKKIVVAFDNLHFSEGAMQFIVQLHQLSPVSLTGVFLPQIEAPALWSASAGAMAGPTFLPLVQDTETETVTNTISLFEQCCRKHKIRYAVHKDFYDFTLNGLKQETRFADLLVIGSEAFYQFSGTGYINEFLQDTLQNAECPVLLVPEKFDFPQSNLLTYDGSEAAVFAIKQFSYLFPELCDNKTLVIHLNESWEALFPEEERLKDLLARHFQQTACLTLRLDTKKQLTHWLEAQKSSLLVSGSFGRSAFSQLIKRSFIYEAITGHGLPVFIAHK